MILRVAACLLFAVLVCSIRPIAVLAEDGAAVFAAKCGGCHTIGQGPLVGPDLLPSKDKDDAEVRASITRMQSQAGPLSAQEIDTLLQFMKGGGSGGSATTPAKADNLEKAADTPPTAAGTPAGSTEVVEEGDANAGRRFFMGSQSLKNGGMACAACHAADGTGEKNLGPDLSAIANKMNQPALVVACEKTPYKVMKNAYKDHPITHEEAVDLAAFMNTQKGESNSASSLKVEIAGAAAAVVLVGTIALSYRHRKGSARAKLKRR